MKSKNYTQQAKDVRDMHRLVEEYRFIGREVRFNPDTLEVTLLALPNEYKKKRERDARVAAKREREEETYDQYQY